MGVWETKKIQELGRVVTGKTPPKVNKNFFENGKELFVSPKDLDWNHFYVTNTETVVTEKALDKFKNQIIPKNSVMFTCLSFAFGKIGIASRNCLTNQQINTVIVNDDHDYKFVYYLLQAYRPTIFSYNSGIDTPIVPKSVFESIKVKCPPLEVQKNIAEILSAYDDLIETNNQRIVTLEQLAQQIYKEWFVRVRFPGWENTVFNQAVPEGWEEKPLSSFCTFVMGQSPKSEFYNEDGIGLSFHQGVSYFKNRFPLNKVFCSVDGRVAEKEDILFSVRAPVGRINIATQKITIGRGLSAIRHKKGFQNFLFYLLSAYFQSEDIIGNGAIYNSVTKNELSEFKVLYPTDGLIKSFSSIAKPIDEQIEVLAEQNENLTKTRNLLLPRLISGKLSIKQAESLTP